MATYVLNSIDEIAEIAADRQSVGEQVLVFAYRRSTAEFVGRTLARREGLRVETWVVSQERSFGDQLLQRLSAGELDVVVTTVYTGWRAPTTCRTALHVEIPHYSEDFFARMSQREARLRHDIIERFVPDVNRFASSV